MDLKTVRKNLSKGKYKRFEDFFRDIQLIWDNCKTYNIQGSDIYKMAESMEKFSKRQINMCKEDLGIPFGSGSNNKKGKDIKKDKKKEKKDGDEDDPMADEKSEDSGSDDNGNKSASGSEDDEDAEEVPFEQKVQFTEKVRRLTNEGLTKLVKLVK